MHLRRLDLVRTSWRKIEHVQNCYVRVTTPPRMGRCDVEFLRRTNTMEQSGWYQVE